MVNTLEDEKKSFIKNYINKAQTALDDAKLNIEHNRYFTASNRIYYSIFYSVISLGYLENFITSKHKQLMGWFNKKFIFEEKIFDENLMKYIKKHIKIEWKVIMKFQLLYLTKIFQLILKKQNFLLRH